MGQRGVVQAGRCRVVEALDGRGKLHLGSLGCGWKAEVSQEPRQGRVEVDGIVLLAGLIWLGNSWSPWVPGHLRKNEYCSARLDTKRAFFSGAARIFTCIYASRKMHFTHTLRNMQKHRCIRCKTGSRMAMGLPWDVDGSPCGALRLRTAL